VCRRDNNTSILKLQHDDEDGERPVTANIVTSRDWKATDRPNSVCLRSVLQLLTVVMSVYNM